MDMRSTFIGRIGVKMDNKKYKEVEQQRIDQDFWELVEQGRIGRWYPENKDHGKVGLDKEMNNEEKEKVKEEIHLVWNEMKEGMEKENNRLIPETQLLNLFNKGLKEHEERDKDEIREEGVEYKDGKWIDGLGNTNTKEILALQKTTDEYKKDVFWYSDTNGNKPKLAIDPVRLWEWLKYKDFDILTDSKNKTSNFDIISGVKGGVLDKEDETTLSVSMRNYFKDKPPQLWDDETKYGVFKVGKSGDTWCKMEVDRMLVNHSFNTKTFKSNVRMFLPVYDYNTLPLLKDDENNVYLPFRNKTVAHITKKEIKLINIDDIKDKGSIWSSQIIEHDIADLKDGGNNLFEKFCEKATSIKDNKPLPKNVDWTHQYKREDGFYKSLLTAYGYMLSSYNNPSEPVAPIFIDGDAEVGMEEGRNGKSVIMRSIDKWKKMAYMSGRSYRSSSQGGSFQWSNVEVDTKFVIINDTSADFDLEDIYDRLSDDFEIQGKYTNKFIIPQDKKPKIGITTNHPPIQKGGSAKHRMHITPFGNFWLNVREHGEIPSDKKHLGKMLFQHDFTFDDYNEFYWFGFKCVKSYLTHGLYKCNTDRVKLKGLIKKWEDGDDNGVVRWFIDVVENERHKELIDKPGISKTDLFGYLLKHLGKNTALIKVKFDWMNNEGRFQKMIWDICKVMKYKYNDFQSHQGDTPNKRKYLVKGNYHVVIHK